MAPRWLRSVDPHLVLGVPPVELLAEPVVGDDAHLADVGDAARAALRTDVHVVVAVQPDVPPVHQQQL